MRLRITLAATMMLGLCASSADAQIIFSETFDDASSSANFSTTTFSLNNGGLDPADVYSEFGFDYSAAGSSRLSQSIGTSPSAGSSTGLLLAANLGGSNRSSINLYPIISGAGLNTDPTTGLPVIAANYRMTFEFWAGVNGSGPGTGSGTSEYVQFGAQSNGDGKHLNGFAITEPDSDFFEIVTAADFATSDYVGFTTIEGVAQSGAFISQNDANVQLALPDPPYSYQPGGGAVADNWVTAEVTHIDGVTAFLLNGVEIESFAFTDFGNDLGVEGLPWFGYSDAFGSQAGGDSTKVAEPGGGPLVGDYNGDNIVNAADYTVYRDTLGDTAMPSGSGADGNDNGAVDPGDLTVWANSYGNSGPVAGSTFDPFDASFVIIDNVVVELIPAASASTAVPEPSSLVFVSLALVGAAVRRRA